MHVRLVRRTLTMTAGALTLAAGLATPASAAPASADTQAPTTPHLFNVRGTGGCEILLHITMSTDNVTPQAKIRYEVFTNGRLIPGNTTVGQPEPNGTSAVLWPVYLQNQVGTQAVTVVAVDQVGNASAPSNPVSRTLSSPCF